MPSVPGGRPASRGTRKKPTVFETGAVAPTPGDRRRVGAAGEILVGRVFEALVVVLAPEPQPLARAPTSTMIRTTAPPRRMATGFP
jgi:hypothetical protein